MSSLLYKSIHLNQIKRIRRRNDVEQQRMQMLWIDEKEKRKTRDILFRIFTHQLYLCFPSKWVSKSMEQQRKKCLLLVNDLKALK